MQCPICRKAAPREDNPAWPFCSERCRLIDLGKWLDEDYRVPGQADQDGVETADEEKLPAKPHSRS
jgi:hypothetical protein